MKENSELKEKAMAQEPQEYQYDPDTINLIAYLLQGRSLVDFFGPTIKTHEDFVALLAANGYDIRNQLQANKLRKIEEEAIYFVEKMLKQLKEKGYLAGDINPEIDESLLIASMKEIFLIAAGTHPEAKNLHPMVQKQACIILKVIFIIAYMEGKVELMLQDSAYDTLQELLDNNFREIKDKNGSHFELIPKHERRLPKINIKTVYSSKKSRESIIRKLLSKDEVTSATITDYVRARIITETPLDILRLLYVLVKENRIPWNLSLSKSPKQQYFDLENLKRIMDDAETADQFVQTLMKNPYIVEGLTFKKRKKKDRNDNEASNENFVCLSWVFEIPVEVEINGKQTFIYYPVELQLADEERAKRNGWRKSAEKITEASHDKYEEGILCRVGARVRAAVDRIMAEIKNVDK